MALPIQISGDGPDFTFLPDEILWHVMKQERWTHYTLEPLTLVNKRFSQFILAFFGETLRDATHINHRVIAKRVKELPGGTIPCQLKINLKSKNHYFLESSEKEKYRGNEQYLLFKDNRGGLSRHYMIDIRHHKIVDLTLKIEKLTGDTTFLNNETYCLLERKHILIHFPERKGLFIYSRKKLKVDGQKWKKNFAECEVISKKKYAWMKSDFWLKSETCIFWGFKHKRYQLTWEQGKLSLTRIDALIDFTQKKIQHVAFQRMLVRQKESRQFYEVYQLHPFKFLYAFVLKKNLLLQMLAPDAFVGKDAHEKQLRIFAWKGNALKDLGQDDYDPFLQIVMIDKRVYYTSEDKQKYNYYDHESQTFFRLPLARSYKQKVFVCEESLFVTAGTVLTLYDHQGHFRKKFKNVSMELYYCGLFFLRKKDQLIVYDLNNLTTVLVRPFDRDFIVSNGVYMEFDRSSRSTLRVHQFFLKPPPKKQ